MQSEKWNRAKDEIVDASGAPLTARANPTDRPQRLFHFTDSAGLVGILQSRSLRASLATALNDPSEIAHGLACTRDVLARGGTSVPKDFLEMTNRFLDPANVRPAYRLEWRAYVISFCASVDHAVHWLHYGRSGTGAAIGFNANAVQRAPFDLFKVVHTPDEQHCLVASVIQATAEALEHALADPELAERDALREVAAHIAAGRLWALAPLMKNAAFAAEEEWRLITHDLRGERIPSEHLVPLAVGYRTTSGRVVPFQELVFDDLPALHRYRRMTRLCWRELDHHHSPRCQDIGVLARVKGTLAPLGGCAALDPLAALQAIAPTGEWRRPILGNPEHW